LPNGTPPAVIARLTPEQLGALMKSDTTKWHKIVKDAGIKPE